MNRVGLAIVLVFLLSGCGTLTKKDVILESIFTAEHLVDWRQTREAIKYPDKYEEKNIILGSHPSQKKLDRFMAGTLAAHWLVVSAMPEGWRTPFQAGTIGVKTYVIYSNHRAGIRIMFNLK